MSNWEQDNISKREPTAEELDVIEKGIEKLLKESNRNFCKKHSKGEVINGGTLIGAVKLSKEELDIVDEMVRIIEDPQYVSAARIKRYREDEDLNEADLLEISFENNLVVENSNTENYDEYN